MTQQQKEFEFLALDQATEWLVKLHDDDFDKKDRLALEQWLQASKQNQQAWQKAEALMNKFGQLPPSIAMPILNRPSDSTRRSALNKFAMALIAAPLSWGSWRYSQSQGWTADHHTAKGEQRTVQLADGSQLILNTDTAINISFDATQRYIQLIRGELMIQTAKEQRSTYRPFRIATAQGTLEALGTRFNVYQRSNETHLAVLEGAVRIEAKQAPHKVLHAGEQTMFSQFSIAKSQPVSSAHLAWTKGMLIADNMRLADFISQLRRYRPGIIRYEPILAELRVSGAFPLNNTAQILTMLVATYPIQLSSVAADYWITLSAKS